MINRRVVVVVEGDDDRVLVRALEATLANAAHMQLSERQKRAPEGLSAAERTTASHIHARAPVVLIRDLDDLEPPHGLLAQVRRWLPAAELRVTPLAGTTHAVAGTAVGDNGRSPFAIVGCGLPNIGTEIAIDALTRFAVDDYALRLAHSDDIFPHVGDAPSLAQSRTALRACVEVIRREGIELSATKRVGLLLRAVAGFRASSTEFLHRLLEVAATRGVDVAALLEPLRTDLDYAIAHCLSPHEP